MAQAQLRDVIQHVRKALASVDSCGVPDEELLKRFIGHRDEAAFELLVWRHSRMVLNTCHRLLRSVHDAEDVFQACFLVLAQRAASIGHGECLGGWLHRVAYRLALRAKRRRSSRVCEQGFDAESLPTYLPDPPTQAVQRELRNILDEELNRLPDKYRVPFVLCYLQGQSNAAIARQLGCPMGTVASRLNRARGRLRASFLRRGVTVSTALLATVLGQNATSAPAPSAVATSTAKAAMFLAARQAAAAGLISTEVALLADGMVQALLITKGKIAAALLLAAILLGGGTGALAYRSAAAEQPAAAPIARQNHQGEPPEATSIAELIGKLGSTAFAEREQATKQLDQIGIGALDALREAAQSRDPEQRSRSASLVRQIEGRALRDKLLAPRQVHLVYRDTPLTEAVADFKVKSGYDIALDEACAERKNRKITLDTGAVTFWRALDLFCHNADLTELRPEVPGPVPVSDPDQERVFRPGLHGLLRHPGGMQPLSTPSRIILTKAQTQKAPTDDHSAVRVRVRGKTHKEDLSSDEILLPIEITPELKLRWLQTVVVQSHRAVDDQGQTWASASDGYKVLDPGRPASPPEGLPALAPGSRALCMSDFDPGVRVSQALLRLKKGGKTAKVLQEVSGTITARVLAEPQTIAAVDDLPHSAGKTATGVDGALIKVLEVHQERNGRIGVRFESNRPGDLCAHGGCYSVFSQAGRIKLFGGLPALDAPVHELTLLDDDGNILPPCGFEIHLTQALTIEFELFYLPQASARQAVKLVYSVSNRLTIDVPFTLRNVPLP